ncbi:SLAIN motif-containing protein-like isoform X1 [Phyllopteryx taeniolatus]|uniref:SLAIN motif-containing protein-like isoform X1 n=1 Tax=Phyllopteryx taeniolatus TaxID=161469 RepID=UPI002AD2EDCB|nr:SLAIN motif-containing protein-like isoform X1 [Phyllopteryx taeniolatus]
MDVRDRSLDLNGDTSSKHPASRTEGESAPHPGVWAEATGLEGCTSRCFAREARMRLDFLKLGSHCQVSSRAKGAKTLGDEIDKGKDPGTQTVLDLVELLEFEDEAEDDESWLYEAPKRQMSADESPLRWCRHVLDNPSPETEAASRSLMNKLQQKPSRSYPSVFSRQPAVQHHADGASVDPYNGQASANTTQDTADTFDNSDLSTPCESITTSYKLQDITDVHLMARIQEDSLRQDYISVPACVSERQSLEPQVRLRQQVTQFKLLKRAQNRGRQSLSIGGLSSHVIHFHYWAPLLRESQMFWHNNVFMRTLDMTYLAARTESPLRTSLRSLQALRNSRSLDTDDCLPAHRTSDTDLPSASANSVERPQRARGSSVQKTVTRDVQRSQSLGPRRVPQRAKRILWNACVYASPERSAAAWGGDSPTTRR